MWWYGRGNSGGSWLPEEKKANMWYGRGNSGGSWPPAFPRSYGCTLTEDINKSNFTYPIIKMCLNMPVCYMFLFKDNI